MYWPDRIALQQTQPGRWFVYDRDGTDEPLADVNRVELVHNALTGETFCTVHRGDATTPVADVERIYCWPDVIYTLVAVGLPQRSTRLGA